MKYEGLLTEHLRNAEPLSQCAAEQQQSEGIGLTIHQLTGIWVIVFSFAVGGLMAKGFGFLNSKKVKTMEVQKVLIYDQWGRAMENIELNRPNTGGNDPRYQNALQSAKNRVPTYVSGHNSHGVSANRKRPSAGQFSITSRNNDQAPHNQAAVYANDPSIGMDMDDATKRRSNERPPTSYEHISPPEQGLPVWRETAEPQLHTLHMDDEEELVGEGPQDQTVVSM